jgi:hypothetical protein
MEIHSSSLASTPIGHNVKNRNDEVRLSSNSKVKDKTQIQPVLSLPSPKTSKVNFKTTDLQQISAELENQKKSTTNPQNSRALNAYIQENIQPLKNQRSELISGIDLFA